MNHKSLLAIACVAISLSACNNKPAEDTTAAVADVPATAASSKIAYVEIDSLMSQYQFAKDFTIILTKKGENIQSTLASKQRELEQQAASMQKKYESGGFATSAELQNAQQDLAARQKNLQALGERLTADFQVEQAKYNTALRDSIQAYLRIFNKDMKYDIILSRAGDNLLFANPHMDITAQIVEGLNKRYTPSAELKEKLDNK